MYSRLFFAFVTSTVIKHHVCGAWVIKKDFTFDTTTSTLEKLHESPFGFNAQGTLTWNLSCVVGISGQPELPVPTEYIRLFLCPKNDVDKVDKKSRRQLCKIGYSQCRVLNAVKVKGNKRSLSWLVNSSIESQGFYVSYSLNCGVNVSMKLSCKSHLVLLNPGGEHLSYDEVPLPVVYLVGISVWSGILITWLINWIGYWRYSNPLHRLLFVVPLVKLGLHIILYLKWESKSHTGYDDKSLETPNCIVRSVQESLLFLMLMLVADGWYVTCVHTTIFRWIGMATLFFGLLGSLLCVEYIHEYFLAFAVCCCLFMLYKALKWATSNIDSLLKQRQQMSSYILRLGLSYVSECTVGDLLLAKINMYRKFRSFVIMWAVVSVIGIAAVLFLTEHTWIRALAIEVPEVVIVSGVLILFRLRSFEWYRSIKLKVPESDYTVVYGPAGRKSHYPVVYLAEKVVQGDSRLSNEETDSCQVETVV